MDEQERAMLIAWGQYHHEQKVRQLADELQRVILQSKRKNAVIQTLYSEIGQAVRQWK